jgi:hypothetical protein
VNRTRIIINGGSRGGLTEKIKGKAKNNGKLRAIDASSSEKTCGNDSILISLKSMETIDGCPRNGHRIRFKIDGTGCNNEL